MERPRGSLPYIPIEEHGFALHKGAFRDALCLRYGWRPPLLPSQCVCNSMEHALSCRHGGFPTIRHNEIRDITAHLMSELLSQRWDRAGLKKGHASTSGFSIHFLFPCQRATEGTKKKKEEPTTNVSERSSMDASHHSSSPRLVAWDQLPRWCTRSLLP